MSENENKAGWACGTELVEPTLISSDIPRIKLRNEHTALLARVKHALSFYSRHANNNVTAKIPEPLWKEDPTCFEAQNISWLIIWSSEVVHALPAS
jgi:hypothetical protein